MRLHKFFGSATIVELERKFNVSRGTIRAWEKRGYLKESTRCDVEHDPSSHVKSGYSLKWLKFNVFNLVDELCFNGDGHTLARILKTFPDVAMDLHTPPAKELDGDPNHQHYCFLEYKTIWNDGRDYVDIFEDGIVVIRINGKLYRTKLEERRISGLFKNKERSTDHPFA